MTLRQNILELLAVGCDDCWYNGSHGIVERLQSGRHPSLRPEQAMEALWQLVADGLAYVDYRKQAPAHWRWRLTTCGDQAAKSDSDFKPYDGERYLEALRKKIPNLDPITEFYIWESLRAFAGRSYTAAAVILGVAAEQEFFVIANAFTDWLGKVSPAESEGLSKRLNDRRLSYLEKYKEFRKRVEPRKDRFPIEFSDNMAMNLDAVFDMLRVSRNESGHPTGRSVGRDEAHSNLIVFACLLTRLDALRAFFRE